MVVVAVVVGGRGFLHNRARSPDPRTARPEFRAAMMLDCPHCATRYSLPETLLGPAGARVRCPSCGRGFVVDAGGVLVAPPAPLAAPVEPAGVRATDAEPAGVIARELISGLLASSGEELARARARGTLFAEWGATLLDLFDEYRRRAGPAPGAAPFRRALREQLGVELPEAR